MSTNLFSYRITYKVKTSHTPFQLVYGLHPLLLTEYMLPSKPSEYVNPKLIRILTSRLLELKNLQENKLIAHDLVVSN
jgi:hypothetical protein